MKSADVFRAFDNIGARLKTADAFLRLRREIQDYWDVHDFKFKAWKETNDARILARNLDGLVFW